MRFHNHGLAHGRVLALHGFTGGGADFTRLAQHALPDWDWLCPDLPGHGGSCDMETAASCGLESSGDWLCKVLETFAQLNPLLVLGYSMGGRLALSLLAQGRLKADALVLIGSSPGIISPAERQKRRDDDAALADMLEQEGLRVFLEHWARHPLIASQSRISPEIGDALTTTRRAQLAAGLAASLRGFGTGSMPPVWHALGQISIPVLCVTGAEDTRYDSIATAMVSQIPNASHQRIPGAGHMAHLENPAAFAHCLHTFVADI